MQSDHKMEVTDDDVKSSSKRAKAAASTPVGKVYLGGNTKRAAHAISTDSTAPANAKDEDDDADDCQLEFDRSTYRMYHSCQILYPCMSFDVVDSSDAFRNKHPAAVAKVKNEKVSFPIPSCYIVAGTQAEHATANRLLVMKMSNLTALKQKSSSGKNNNDEDDDSSSDSDSDSDAEEEDLPELETCEIRQRATINRLRMNFVNESKPFVACWYDNNKVSIWDVQQQLATLNDSRAMQQYKQDDRNRQPVFTFHGHKSEGFAVDWSPVNKGYLATGACDGAIYVWRPAENAQSWYVDGSPLSVNSESVEDIQWSPTEPNVLASSSCDKSLRIWDIRQAGVKACMLTCPDAHEGDVNVISWNRLQTHLLLSGGDDGVIKVWDLRKFGNLTNESSTATLATFKFHTGPITSLEWCPHDASVFAASSEDDRLSQWDISVERDTDMSDAAAAGETVDEAEEKILAGLPPQLLFVHCGQTEIKELHWHSQYAGVVLSTAQQGVDIFKTISV